MPRALLLLTVVNLVNYADRYVMNVVGPEIQKDFGLSDFTLGILLNGFMIGYMLTSPLFGRLGDTGHRPRLMAIGVVVWSVATFVCGFAQSFWLLFLARLFVGIGEASYGTISPSYIKDAARDDKEANLHFAIFYVALPIGAALGFIAGGAIAQNHSWQMAFFVAAIPGLFLAWRTWRLPELEHRQVSEKKSWGEFGRDLQQLWGLMRYRGVILGYVLYTFAMGGFAAWAPKYGVDVLGVDLQTIGLAVGIITLTSATLGTLLGGKLGELFVSRGLTVEGFSLFSGIVTLAAVPFAVFAFLSDNLIEFSGNLFVCEFLMFAATAPINTATLAAAPRKLAATAMALSIFAIHALGDLISPPLVGLLSDHYGLQKSMMILPVAGLFSGLIWVQTCRKGYYQSPASKQNFPMGPLALGLARIAQWAFRRAATVFFREITVLRSSQEQAALKVKSPELRDDVPTLLIANHPNALIDAVLVYSTARQNLRAVGKSTLWNTPVLRPLLKLAGAVPVLRKQDAGEALHAQAAKVDSNEDAIIEVARALSRDSFVIYPEGISHDEPNIQAFKTGGARMLLLAARLTAERARREKPVAMPDLELSVTVEEVPIDFRDLGFQPVGLMFDEITKFRSRAVVHYGRRVTLREIFNEDELKQIELSGPVPELVRHLTERMGSELRDLIPEAPDKQTLVDIRRMAALMLEPMRRPKFGDRYRWEVLIKNLLASDQIIPREERERLVRQVREYFVQLDAMGTPDDVVRDFGGDPKHFFQRAVRNNALFWGLCLLSSPMILLGYLMYAWVVRLVEFLANRMTPYVVEVATYKFLGAIIFFSVSTLIYVVNIAAYFFRLGKPGIGLVAAVCVPPLAGLAALAAREKFMNRWRELWILVSPSRRQTVAKMAEQRYRLVDDMLTTYEASTRRI
jgi:MFS family permease